MSKGKKSNGEVVGGDYQVGYGRPPKHTRFKRGHSGNPKGRPKGVRNFKTDVKATLKSPVRVTRDGKPRNVSTQQAMLLRLREKALGGDARALDRAIALAQAYNNEELAAAATVTGNDTMLLDIFAARVLSGAAGRSNSNSEGASEGALSGGLTDLDAPTEHSAKRARTRSKKPQRSGGELEADIRPGVKGDAS